MKHLYLRFILLCTSCLYCVNTTAQALSTIPFQYHQSLIFVKAKINGNKAFFTFLLNTGANKTVIDTRTADILKLPVIRDADTVEGTAGTEIVSTIKLNQLQAGTAVVKDMEVSKRDLSRFVTLKGQKIDGILGTDFLQHYAMSVDFGAKKIAFTKPKLAATKQKCIPFDMKDGIPRCSVKLNDTLPTYLHYNSGVSLEPNNYVYVNLSQEQWAALKKVNPYINHGSYMTGKGVGGDVYLQVVKINTMSINNMPIKTPYLIIQNKDGYFKRADAIGFFGNNLLEKYKKVTVDFPNNRVMIDAQRKPPAKNMKNKIAKNKVS